MPNDERILETMPTGTLVWNKEIKSTASCPPGESIANTSITTILLSRNITKRATSSSLIFHDLVPEKRNVLSISLSGAMTSISW